RVQTSDAATYEMKDDLALNTVLASLESNGATHGLVGGAFAPGLMTGLSGMVYQLLRAHPQSKLPSVMLPGGGRSYLLDG
ncbi:hypothetical protein, partial [Staphylococcus aureus]